MGNQPLSLPEQRAHFALWALMKSPLLIGTDLRKASPEVMWHAEMLMRQISHWSSRRPRQWLH